jgi:hypothetical protein
MILTHKRITKKLKKKLDKLDALHAGQTKSMRGLFHLLKILGIESPHRDINFYIDFTLKRKQQKQRDALLHIKRDRPRRWGKKNHVDFEQDMITIRREIRRIGRIEAKLRELKRYEQSMQKRN